jgi:hypothetical protein
MNNWQMINSATILLFLKIAFQTYGYKVTDVLYVRVNPTKR